MEYKMAINEYKDQCESKLTDDLSESLLDKNMNDFWKSWRNKFGKRDTKAKIVEGYNSNEDIVQAFKSFFSQTCVPNDPSTHLKHKKVFEREFAGYLENENENEDVDSFFTVSDVDSAFLKMKKGKAVGVDMVSSEHLIYAHPCLVVSLKMLFNLMFFYGYVPTEFGKVTLIPLLKDSSADASVCENYRGISLSCAISKVFEYAVLCKFSSLFQTDSLQFGFRSGIGCSDALFTVKSVIDYFTKNGCTLTVSALDISKAFDRVSFYALFSKLMARQFPKPIIRVLLSWYEKSFTSVKWNDCASEWFQVTAGVRQGGVLSPFLFAIYIEDVLKQLKLHGKGCKIGGVYLGCFLYADDILLISQSVSCMQDMLNICCKVANELDLKFNEKKSVVMRIGNRCNMQCNELLLDGTVLPFVEELKYLGVIIRKSLKFSRSLSSSKIKFYRSFNSIYSKVPGAPEDVLIQLFKSFCLPIITYACEALIPTRADLKVLDKLITSAFNKIFKSFDCSIIASAKACFDMSSIEELLCKRQKTFLARYYGKCFSFSSTIYGINRCLA